MAASVSAASFWRERRLPRTSGGRGCGREPGRGSRHRGRARAGGLLPLARGSDLRGAGPRSRRGWMLVQGASSGSPDFATSRRRRPAHKLIERRARRNGRNGVSAPARPFRSLRGLGGSAVRIDSTAPVRIHLAVWGRRCVRPPVRIDPAAPVRLQSIRSEARFSLHSPVRRAGRRAPESRDPLPSRLQNIATRCAEAPAGRVSGSGEGEQGQQGRRGRQTPNRSMIHLSSEVRGPAKAPPWRRRPRTEQLPIAGSSLPCRGSNSPASARDSPAPGIRHRRIPEPATNQEI